LTPARSLPLGLRFKLRFESPEVNTDRAPDPDGRDKASIHPVPHGHFVNRQALGRLFDRYPAGRHRYFSLKDFPNFSGLEI
jgi:hypothetical protein